MKPGDRITEEYDSCEAILGDGNLRLKLGDQYEEGSWHTLDLDDLYILQHTVEQAIEALEAKKAAPHER